MATGGAAAIVIGDEVLSGKVRDQNGPYLIDKLRSIGVPLRRILVVADDVDEIAWALKCCLPRYRPIFTSGGIGPTHDDLTVAGVARALALPVVRHPEIEAAVREHWGAQVTEEALRLANVPEGAELYRSARSWYPVVGIDEIYLLPGVPQLFRMHVDSLADRYRTTPFVLRCLYVNASESAIAAVLDRVAAAHGDVAIGSYPRFDLAEYQVKRTVAAKDAVPVEAAVQDLLAHLPAGSVVRVE